MRHGSVRDLVHLLSHLRYLVQNLCRDVLELKHDYALAEALELAPLNLEVAAVVLILEQENLHGKLSVLLI